MTFGSSNTLQGDSGVSNLATIQADTEIRSIARDISANQSDPNLLLKYFQSLAAAGKITDATIMPVLHRIREQRQRIPSQAYLIERCLRNSWQSSQIEAPLRELNTKGIVRISNWISAPLLSGMQAEFEAVIQRIKNAPPVAIDKDGFTEEYHNQRDNSFVVNDPFKHSPSVVQTCLMPNLLDLINDYLGGYGYVHQAVGSRILPDARTGYGSFQWHHDAWGKRINAMILLTDIGDTDQYMTFVEGSHLHEYPYERYAQSRFTQQEVDQIFPQAPVFKATGRAGDIIIFDPNGLHSGNRTQGRTRDVFIVNFTRDPSYTWNMQVPSSVLAGRTDEELRPLMRLLRANRAGRPIIPRYRSWVEGLQDLSCWWDLDNSEYNS